MSLSNASRAATLHQAQAGHYAVRYYAQAWLLCDHEYRQHMMLHSTWYRRHGNKYRLDWQLWDTKHRLLCGTKYGLQKMLHATKHRPARNQALFKECFQYGIKHSNTFSCRATNAIRFQEKLHTPRKVQSATIKKSLVPNSQLAELVSTCVVERLKQRHKHWSNHKFSGHFHKHWRLGHKLN